MRNVKDAVWISAKVRAHAEAKLKRKNDVLLISTATYAALLIFFQFLESNTLLSEAFRDSYSQLVGLYILIVSLVVYAKDYSGQASRHRECYIQLFDILDNSEDENELGMNYHKIMKQHENHSDVDFQEFLISRKILYGEKVTSGEREKQFSSLSFLLFMKRIIIFYILVFFPAIVLAYYVARNLCHQQ